MLGFVNFVKMMFLEMWRVFLQIAQNYLFIGLENIYVELDCQFTLCLRITVCSHVSIHLNF